CSSIRATRARPATGSTDSGSSPSSPITTAPSVPWPAAVAARETYRCTETSATRAPVSGSSSTSRANLAAARIGPTVWELDGPMPSLNRSNVLTLITCLLGGPAPRRATGSRPLLVGRRARTAAAAAPARPRRPRPGAAAARAGPALPSPASLPLGFGVPGGAPFLVRPALLRLATIGAARAGQVELAGRSLVLHRGRILRRLPGRCTTAELGERRVRGGDHLLGPPGLDLGLAEDPPGGAQLVGQREGDHAAGGAGPSGAARAVHVLLHVVGGIDVDHHGDVVDVQAAGGDVGRHQHGEGALAESGQDVGAQPLL